jgi:rhodanese-related sulfurtransferase
VDQRKKFISKPASWRIKRLLCWVLSLGMSPALLAQSPLAVPSGGFAEKPTKDRLAPVKARLAKQYPDVHHLSIEDYLTRYPQAVLVDVRAAEEFAVSRIPGAVHIEDRAELLAFARGHSDAQLILYCSVGARSAEAARFLQEQGQAQGLAQNQQVGEVANLAGSLFEWANQKRPLENDAGPTTEVHSFNAFWGWRYLD